MNNKYRVACFGEVLWDLLPTGAKLGGAPLNVAYHLQQLGVPAAMISRIGKDERGEEILQEVELRKLSTAYIQTDELLPTGIVNATPGHNHEMSYEIVSSVAWDNIQWQEELDALVSNADYFVFGSLAARENKSRNTLFRLLDNARRKVLDINLRSPHYNKDIIEALLNRADVVKMNDNELDLLSGWFDANGNMEEKIRLLQEQFGLPVVMVTRGAAGAVMNVDGRYIEHPGYKVTVADTVGSGDSFLAAVIAATINGKSAAEALDYACRVGALVASKISGTPFYDLAEIEQVGTDDE